MNTPINTSELASHLDDKFFLHIKKFGRFGTMNPPIPTVAPKASWLPDKYVSKCVMCQAGFTATKRRHHCRYCGFLICNGCASKHFEFQLSNEKNIEQTKSLRVCDACYSLLSPKLQQPVLSGLKSFSIRNHFSNDLDYRVANQQFFASRYFVKLLAFDSGDNPQYIHKLALRALIKLSSLNQESIGSVEELYFFLVKKAFDSESSIRPLAMELLANLISEDYALNRKNLENLEFEQQVVGLPTLILSEPELNTREIAARLFYNYVSFCDFSNKNIKKLFDSENISSLIKILQNKENGKVVFALALGSLLHLSQDENLQREVVNNQGIQMLSFLFSEENTNSSITLIHFATQLISKLSKDVRNLDDLLKQNFNFIPDLLNAVEVPQILLHVVNFINNIVSYNPHAFDSFKDLDQKINEIYSKSTDQKLKSKIEQLLPKISKNSPQQNQQNQQNQIKTNNLRSSFNSQNKSNNLK
ncbi:pleckstrin [Anaeramoeba ignava]|uniref:Pleckstrin n=1 Tax=Anaeramoeba ignava TaxID=1746090 RepID=A0A9Q0RGT4_ANAIG|nr:pleckstrin [Anaeramoeba ignava]